MVAECKTVDFLTKIYKADGDMALIARSALGIIHTMRDSDLNPEALSYLQELIDYIYQESGEPLLDHLRDGADCDICSALADKSIP